MTNIKKIFFSFLVIGLVGVIAFGATRAYFTAGDEVLGNTIAAGQLDLDLLGAVSQGVHIEDLMPSKTEWTAPMQLGIYNTALSTSEVKYKFHSEFDSESVPSFYDLLRVRVRHFHANGDPLTWPIVYEGPLKDMVIISNETPGIISPTLDTNTTHKYYLEFRLASSAGNEYQGASATFDIVAISTQPENPGWTE
jgi:hypothetical protein